VEDLERSLLFSSGPIEALGGGRRPARARSGYPMRDR